MFFHICFVDGTPEEQEFVNQQSTAPTTRS